MRTDTVTIITRIKKIDVSNALKLDGAAKVSAYICGIVVLEHSGNAWHYAGERLVETLVGIVVALALSLVPKLIRVDGDGAGPA